MITGFCVIGSFKELPVSINAIKFTSLSLRPMAMEVK